jgi:hypothetical protein
MGNRFAERIIPALAITLLWAVAITAWWATLWHADTFMGFGGDLPSWSIMVVESARLGLPFVMAGLFTLAIIYTTLRHSAQALLVSCGALCIATALSLVVMIGLTSPLTRLCGEFVPGWPSAIESTGGNTGSDAVANKPGPNECRH